MADDVGVLPPKTSFSIDTIFQMIDLGFETLDLVNAELFMRVDHVAARRQEDRDPILNFESHPRIAQDIVENRRGRQRHHPGAVVFGFPFEEVAAEDSASAGFVDNEDIRFAWQVLLQERLHEAGQAVGSPALVKRHDDRKALALEVGCRCVGDAGQCCRGRCKQADNKRQHQFSEHNLPLPVLKLLFTFPFLLIIRQFRATFAAPTFRESKFCRETR